MTFYYQYPLAKFNLICEIEYEEEELGSVDSYGLKNEPDYPEQFTLLRACIDAPNMDKYDISDLLSEEVVEDILDKAKATLELYE